MSGFDRKAFKGASLEKQKEFSKKIDSMTKTGGDNKRPDYHEIKDGVNVFRICPPHSQDDPAWQPKMVTWLPQRIEKKDKEGKGTGEYEIVNRPIFNSRVHGGTAKDIVEVYIDFAYKMVYDEVQDKDERQKRMAPVSGYRDKQKKWHQGIKYSTSYVWYAFKESVLGRLELYKADKDRMEELNISEDAEDPITTDIFSDPDNGVSLIITIKKEGEKKERVLSKREFDKAASKKFKTYDEFIESEQLTDEQLKLFAEKQPLKEIFQNVYKRSDFKKALEGLQIFDEKNKYGVFENDEFIAAIEEIDSYYPEEDEEAPTNTTSNNSVSFLDEMDREELKSYISTNELGIVVKKSMTEDDIRAAILEAIKDAESSQDDEVEQPISGQTGVNDKLPWEEKEEKTTPPVNDKAKQKLEELRSRMGKK